MEHSPAFLMLVEASRKRILEVGTAEVQAMIRAGDGFRLVDVREDGEWARGRLPGAIHLGRGILERDVEKTIPERDARIVLYCGGGYRSALAAESLQRMGYSNVFSMAGGWREWVEKGLPTERP